jgi:hypothetical protein
MNNKKLIPFLILLLPFLLGCMLFGPSPASYQAAPGECFVPPKGDAVYDQFYANEVNPQNCAAFEEQSQAFAAEANAEYINAQTERARTETTLNLAGAGITTAIVAAFIIVVIIGMTRA